MTTFLHNLTDLSIQKFNSSTVRKFVSVVSKLLRFFSKYSDFFHGCINDVYIILNFFPSFILIVICFKLKLRANKFSSECTLETN